MKVKNGLVITLVEDEIFMCLAVLLCEQFCRFANGGAKISIKSYFMKSYFLSHCFQQHTLVQEAFFYSLLANFATRIASYIFFHWHEALRAKKRKPLVATVGNLTFMPSAFDRRF